MVLDWGGSQPREIQSSELCNSTNKMTARKFVTCLQMYLLEPDYEFSMGNSSKRNQESQTGLWMLQESAHHGTIRGMTRTRWLSCLPCTAKEVLGPYLELDHGEHRHQWVDYRQHQDEDARHIRGTVIALYWFYFTTCWPWCPHVWCARGRSSTSSACCSISLL